MAPSVTVLQLDTDFPRIPGDVGCPDTFCDPIEVLRISNATVGQVVTSNPASIPLEPFEDAITHASGDIIVTSCGFLSYWQAHLSGLSNRPFISSALTALPTLCKRYMAEDILTVTFDAGSLNANHFGQHQTDVVGLPPDMHLRQVISQNQSSLNIHRATQEISDFVTSQIKPHHKHILFECTNLSPYKHAIAARTDLPISDILSCIEAVRPGTVRLEFLNTERKTMPSDFASAKQSNAQSIPVVDVSGAISGDDIQGVADAIHAAAIDHGFFYISNHGIDPALMDQAFAVSKAFFELPEDEKQAVAVDTHQRGWLAQGMSRLQGSKTHDLKEVFFWGTETTAEDPDVVACKPLCAVNQWPTDFPRLQSELTPYYDAVCNTARHLMAAIAVSLNQPADFFDEAYQKPLARGQLVYYPASTETDEAEERFGVAPHTDFGVLTMLLQDTSGGLQVRAKSGEWIEAPPIPGTLVCNIGDLLARWSNNRFASTVHRVINRTSSARYSVPVFFDPHTDTVIDPVDLGVSKVDSLFEPVRTGQHIMGRNAKSFAQYKK